jgi:riboflavin kinase|tara:strand:- start:1817 stop:2455 length:639 start_codon:yes stop_codon:yes gene_type:complete
MYEYFELLTYIAKKEGLFGKLKTSTLSISKELNISQQTISRKLREMENNGLIKRTATPNGLTITIDNIGRDLLQENYKELTKLFKARKKSILGIVKKGIGEGSYYVSQKPYQKQFKAKLGFNAYPGTLNLKINKEELTKFLANKEPIKISSFSTKTRTFGSLTAYKLKISNIQAAIVIPERTRHSEDIIEIIAPVNLRDSLKLADGNKVKII